MRPRSLPRLLLLHCAWLGLSALALAQDLVRVEAHVTAVSASSLYLDRGLDAGLRVDDSVTIFLDSGIVSEGRVRSVTRTSARVELLPGVALPTSGARAEVRVPSERLQSSAEGPGHPPWEAQNPDWSPERPLLAPAFGATGSERKRETTGSLYARFSGTFDQQSGSRSYTLASLGLDSRTTNPFGKGGELDISAEEFVRSTELASGTDTSTDFSLRRLSYSFGGVPGEPTRWEFGRFLQHEFPELGLLDGAEWTETTAGGSHLGASLGAMPEPFPTLTTGDDVQAALYYRWSADRDETLTVGTAYQNTWHKGAQDRNLFLGTLDWISSRDFNLHSTAWVDFYGPGDTVKSNGFELTELSATAAWRAGERGNLTLDGSYRRYPEMLRQEFVALDPALLLHGHIERVGLGWAGGVGKDSNANARADFWQDQDDSGANYAAGVSWRDVPWNRGELSLSGYYADGTFSSGPGARVSVTRAWDKAFGTLAYSYSNYDQKGFVGSAASIAHESLFGSLDLTLGSSWDLSIYAEDRFGDQLDTWDLGLSLQMRF